MCRTMKAWFTQREVLVICNNSTCLELGKEPSATVKEESLVRREFAVNFAISFLSYKLFTQVALAKKLFLTL